MSSIFTNVQSTNTVLGLLYQLHSQIKTSPIPVALEHTLNSKYSVADSHDLLSISPGDHKLGYFGIGSGGAYSLDNISTPYIPNASNMDIYKPYPIRVIPKQEVDDGLVGDIDNYRMRTEYYNATINATFYCYWLKKITYDSNSLNVSNVTLSGLTSDYEFDAGNLNPVANLDALADITSRAHVSIVGECVITGEELAEAAEYHEDFTVVDLQINEIGFYNGVEVDIGSGDHNECVATQLCVHRCMSAISMTSLNKVVEIPLILTNGSSMLSGTYI